MPLELRMLFHPEMDSSNTASCEHLQLKRLPDFSEARVGEQYSIR